MFSHPPTEVFNGGNGTTANGVSTRQPIPGVASLRVNPERIERMWADDRAAARRGRTARRSSRSARCSAGRHAGPSEVPLGGDGEFFFISAYLAD